MHEIETLVDARADPGRARARAVSRGALPPIVGRGRLPRRARRAGRRRERPEASVAIEFMPGALAVQVDDDGDGAPLARRGRGRSPPRSAAGSAAVPARAVPGAGVAADRRPAAVSRSAAQQRVERGPARAAAPDRAEHRAPQRRLGDVAHGDRRLAVGAHEVGQQRHRLTVARPARAASAGRRSGGARRARTRRARGRRGSSARRSGCGALPIAHAVVAQRGQRHRARRSAASGCSTGSISRNCSSTSGSRSSRGSGGRGRNGYSSPSTRSRLPSASAGIDASGSMSVTSTRSAGCSALSRAQRGREQVQAGGLDRRHAQRAGDLLGGGLRGRPRPPRRARAARRCA